MSIYCSLHFSFRKIRIMTRFFSTLFLFTTTILTFNSCERVLETDINGVKPKLVIVSNFTADNNLEVIITRTKHVTASSNHADVVTNAVVQVYEGETLIEELVLSMPNSGSNALPTYISTDFQPEVGVVYTIKGKAPGYQPVQATDFIPKGTAVGEVGFINTLDVKTGEETADVNFSIDLNFQDDPDEVNYYHILFYQELLGYRIDVLPNGDFDTISVATTEFAEIDFDLIDTDIPHIKFLGEQSMLLKDESFAGEDVNLTIEGNFSFNIEKYLPGTFSVEIRTVSEAYYLYYTTLVNQSQANEDELVEALPVFENVENGNGIFAGYSTETTEFVINP